MNRYLPHLLGLFLLPLASFLLACPPTKQVKEATSDAGPPKERTALEYYNEAVGLYREGQRSGKINYAQVVALYQKALAKDESFREARFNLAAVYEKMGRYQDAVRQLQEILRLDDKNKEALYRLAQINIRQGRYAAAARIFQSYMSQQKSTAKKDVKMLANLASLQVATGDYNRALHNARRIITIDPKSILPYRIMARVYLRQKRYPLVHLVCKLAEKLKDKNGKQIQDGKLYNIKALAYLGQKKTALAFTYFQRAIGASPKLYPALMNLGLLALDHRNYKLAYTALQRAQKIRPLDKKTLLAYAVSLRASGQHKKAEKAYLKLLKHYKNESAALLNLGILYLKFLRKPAKAKTYLRRFIGYQGAQIDSNHIAYKLLKEANQTIQMQAKMKEMERKQKEEQKRRERERKLRAKRLKEAQAKAEAEAQAAAAKEGRVCEKENPCEPGKPCKPGTPCAPPQRVCEKDKPCEPGKPCKPGTPCPPAKKPPENKEPGGTPPQGGKTPQGTTPAKGQKTPPAKGGGNSPARRRPPAP